LFVITTINNITGTLAQLLPLATKATKDYNPNGKIPIATVSSKKCARISFLKRTFPVSFQIHIYLIKTNPALAETSTTSVY
jgi:hypothetical protein